MPGRDIIVVGASAGGVEALSTLVNGLPRDLEAAVFVVLHIASGSQSSLPAILSRAGLLPACHPSDNEPIEYGRIYVAPPDQHLLVYRDRVRLSRGPRENRVRPAVDPLFRSAAIAYGSRVTGVVLTGTLDDGTAGLLAIKQCGGLVVVQDPADALFAGMPSSAIENVVVDYQLALRDIAPLLTRLAEATVDAGEDTTMPNGRGADMDAEARVFEMDPNILIDDDRPGRPSPFGCPECGGVLWELHDSRLIRFRCRTGHAYSAESLLAAQAESFEGALWSALRALEEKASLSRRLVQRARSSGHQLVAARFEQQLQEAETHANNLRNLLLKGTNEQAVETLDLSDQRTGD
jgi:two-component system, chemotaxis family, protein-glutamate methylesterase/glutaminase